MMMKRWNSILYFYTDRRIQFNWSGQISFFFFLFLKKENCRRRRRRWCPQFLTITHRRKRVPERTKKHKVWSNMRMKNEYSFSRTHTKGKALLPTIPTAIFESSQYIYSFSFYELILFSQPAQRISLINASFSINNSGQTHRFWRRSAESWADI